MPRKTTRRHKTEKATMNIGEYNFILSTATGDVAVKQRKRRVENSRGWRL